MLVAFFSSQVFKRTQKLFPVYTLVTLGRLLRGPLLIHRRHYHFLYMQAIAERVHFIFQCKGRDLSVFPPLGLLLLSSAKRWRSCRMPIGVKYWFGSLPSFISPFTCKILSAHVLNYWIYSYAICNFVLQSKSSACVFTARSTSPSHTDDSPPAAKKRKSHDSSPPISSHRT